MANLNSLTIPYLEKLAKECGIKLKKSARKSEKIQKIKNAGIPSSKLNELIKKYLEEKKAEKSKKSIKKISEYSNLEIRVSHLERLTEELLLKINKIVETINFEKSNLNISQKSIQKDENFNKNSTLNQIKTILKEKISPGMEIKINNLLLLKELQQYPLELIQSALAKLIREGVFDAIGGGKGQKIFGNIGKIVRK